MNVPLLATFLFCIIASFCVIECMENNAYTGGGHYGRPSPVPRNPAGRLDNIQGGIQPRNPAGRLDVQGYRPNYGRNRGDEITQEEMNRFHRFRNFNEGPHGNQQNIQNNANEGAEVIDLQYPTSDNESESTSSASAYSGYGNYNDGVYRGSVYGQGFGHHGEGSSHDVYGGSVDGQGYEQHGEGSSHDHSTRRNRPNNRSGQRSNNRNADQRRQTQREHRRNVEGDHPHGYPDYSHAYRGNP